MTGASASFNRLSGATKVHARAFSLLCFRRQMKNSLVAIATLSWTLSVQAQAIVMEGTVTDAASRQPLPFVKVRTHSGRFGTITDTSGHYQLAVKSPKDTIEFSFLGYIPQQFVVGSATATPLDVQLEEDSQQLKAVEVSPGENPAFKVLRQVNAHRAVNDPEKREAYQYETYNKMRLDINRLGKRFEGDRRLQKIDTIYSYAATDTASGLKYLPVLLTESVSDYYYKSNPAQRKEKVKASRVSGVENLQLQQFTGGFYQDINFYNNSVRLFGKAFVSPIAKGGKGFYTYILQPTDTLDGVACYPIQFVPKRRGDAAFRGTVWITDSSFALKKIDVVIPEGVAINHVNNLAIRQYCSEVAPNVWMLTREQMDFQFDLLNDNGKKKRRGFTVHKEAIRRKVVLDQPLPSDFYSGDVVVEDSASTRDEAYWAAHRTQKLSKQEEGVVEMIGALKENRTFNFYKNILFLASSGFWPSTPFEIGTLYGCYGRNAIEGHRISLALRTSNQLSRRLKLEGYVGYGLSDRTVKYGGAVRWKVSNAPRQMLRLGYQNRTEMLGRMTETGTARAFNILLPITPQNKLTMVHKGELSFEKDGVLPLRTYSSIAWTQFSPLGIDRYQRLLPSSGDTVAVDKITSFHIKNRITYTKEEKFLSGPFDRISLGSKYPIVSLTNTWGIKGVLGSEYHFLRFDLAFEHYPFLGPLGRLRYTLYAGKVFGQLPYPLLNVHPGNESISLQQKGFNLMMFHEFISDQWVGAEFEHHFQGLIMNRIPLVRKLKSRLVYTAKIAIGSSATTRHQKALLFPFYTYSMATPYCEMGVGLESILKYIRIDAVWRLSHNDHLTSRETAVRKWGLVGAFVFNF